MTCSINLDYSTFNSNETNGFSITSFEPLTEVFSDSGNREDINNNQYDDFIVFIEEDFDIF